MDQLPATFDAPFAEIGRRLRAYRLGARLPVDDVARRLGISRSALYRYERGDVIKLDTIARIARLIDTSVASLLGVDVEYIANAIAFFERLRQIEADANQLTVLFGPISYLLTSDAYDAAIADILAEGEAFGEERCSDRGQMQDQIGQLVEILAQRKAAYRRNRPAILTLVALPEIERLLATGLVGRPGLSDEVHRQRRALARGEVAHIARLVERPPIGVQIGVVPDPLPTTSFSLARSAQTSRFIFSSFRIGELPNLRIGVAMVTTDPAALKLHTGIVELLWEQALTGEAAARALRGAIERAEVS